MTVLGNLRSRIAGVVDQNLLCDEVQSAGCGESLHVKIAFRIHELHQIDARQVGSRIVEEHVFAARIAGVNPARIRTRMPTVDRGVVLNTGIATVPGTFRHAGQQPLGFILRPCVRAGDHASGPLAALFGGLHELVGYPDRKVGVLEEDRAVSFAIEVRLVLAAGDQRVSLLFFLPLALDELQNVGMPNLQRLHLRGPTSFAAGFHDGRDLIVDAHE